MNTEWRPISGYEGYYEVSNKGVIRSLDRDIEHAVSGTIRRRGRIIRLKPHKDGYQVVTLHKEGRRKNRMVHQLVLEAFVGPCPSGQQTCHNNGDPSDNRVENLRWDTQKENMADKRRHGTDYWFERDHCINGHPWSEENTRISSRGHRECRECSRAKDRRIYARKKALGAHPNTLNGEKTHCKNGHEFSEENTSYEREGRKRVCKACKRDRERVRRARRA